MKNTDLIAVCGGIEKARGIVAGAPDHARVSIPCLDGVMYFSKRNDGKWLKWSDGYSQWLEYFGRVDPMDLAIELDDLRTAITEHDRAVGEREFKVGDLVVGTQQHTGNCVLEYEEWMAGLGEYVRHASPAEIKAGHRLSNSSKNDNQADLSIKMTELSGNAGQLEIAEMIDVSPLVRVSER